MTSSADWRVIDGVRATWFDAPSLIEGAALAGRIVERSADVAIDVRAAGVRVRLDLASDAEVADAVVAAARDLGMAAAPAQLQQLSVAIDSTGPTSLLPFWQRALGYVPDDGGGLVDPLRRDPALRFHQATQTIPLRHRIHFDVVRPTAMVEQAAVGEAYGPYDVCHSDPDGNEVDLVPGDALGDGTATADWQAVFGAMACYRTTSPAQQRDLTATAAALADAAGFPLLIDLRPGLVILDSGKDLWETDAHGLEVDFIDLAGRIQAAARALGAIADLDLPRFTQIFLDAADVEAVRAFWAVTLGYVPDRRDGITDLNDPHRLNPTLVFQELDASDSERRVQRNRIQIELAVPSDMASVRLATAVAAGGRILDEADHRWLVADPEGNELMILASA